MFISRDLLRTVCGGRLTPYNNPQPEQGRSGSPMDKIENPSAPYDPTREQSPFMKKLLPEVNPENMGGTLPRGGGLPGGLPGGGGGLGLF